MNHARHQVRAGAGGGPAAAAESSAAAQADEVGVDLTGRGGDRGGELVVAHRFVVQRDAGHASGAEEVVEHGGTGTQLVEEEVPVAPGHADRRPRLRRCEGNPLPSPPGARAPASAGGVPGRVGEAGRRPGGRERRRSTPRTCGRRPGRRTAPEAEDARSASEGAAWATSPGEGRRTAPRGHAGPNFCERQGGINAPKRPHSSGPNWRQFDGWRGGVPAWNGPGFRPGLAPTGGCAMQLVTRQPSRLSAEGEVASARLRRCLGCAYGDR